MKTRALGEEGSPKRYGYLPDNGVPSVAVRAIEEDANARAAARFDIRKMNGEESAQHPSLG